MKNHIKNMGNRNWELGTGGDVDSITYGVVRISYFVLRVNKTLHSYATKYKLKENTIGNRNWERGTRYWADLTALDPTPIPQVSIATRYAATNGGHSPP